jgi:DNA-binding protein YbaB
LKNKNKKNMLDQFKKIAELKKLQDSFKKEKMTVQKNGVEVVINGGFEVEEIKLNPELNLQDQQETLKKCLNEAREEIQKKMAKIMMNSGISF